MRQRHRRRVSPLVLFLAAMGILVSVRAYSSGFQVMSQGARATGMGLAFAGVADDPTAIFYNPAGMGFQDHFGVYLGGNLLTRTDGGLVGANPFPGVGAVESIDKQWFFTPNLYVVAPLTTELSFGLGVFSSQTMVDLYSQIYDATDPGDLGDSDAWQLRQAYVGKDPETRLAAIRKLLGTGRDGLQKEAARALVARAATFVAPSSDLAADAPELISAMLAGGYDEAAARWIPAVNGMDATDGDRCWAMLALAAPNIADVGTGRINSFIRRDKSRDKVRSALLVAGLAGLGRISADTANSLNRRYDLGLGHVTSWTTMIDAAAARGQPGTVLLLSGTGFQTPAFDRIPAAHLYHSLAALNRTGQGFTARMIAAEALSRT